MSQADSINTTSRRGFLARGAATVAGASLLTTPAFTAAGADPIFDAIEKHKVVRGAVSAAVYQHDYHEDENTERKVDLAFDAETEAACILVSIKATTAAGLVALLRYAIEADTDGMGWPDELMSDDGELVRTWQYFLIENLAETVSDMNVGIV
jgi:hypothetical protein